MMMAPDSTPGPQLSSSAVTALRSALVGFLADERHDESLHSALRAVAREARASRIHAEQLLVALKDVWYGLPAIRDSQDNEKQHRLLQRVVTLCIREYYSA